MPLLSIIHLGDVKNILAQPVHDDRLSETLFLSFTHILSLSLSSCSFSPFRFFVPFFLISYFLSLSLSLSCTHSFLFSYTHTFSLSSVVVLYDVTLIFVPIYACMFNDWICFSPSLSFMLSLSHFYDRTYRRYTLFTEILKILSLQILFLA